jgi:ferredoxin
MPSRADALDDRADGPLWSVRGEVFGPMPADTVRQELVAAPPAVSEKESFDLSERDLRPSVQARRNATIDYDLRAWPSEGGLNGHETRNREITTMAMHVWIDQELCTGDSLCEEICPDSFEVGDDGLAYVKEDAKHFGETRVFGGEISGPSCQARIPAGYEESIVEAAGECPGECIFIEVD